MENQNAYSGIKLVFVDAQKIEKTKLGLKKTCKGCGYAFDPIKITDCFCGQCYAGIVVNGQTQATKSMLLWSSNE